MIVDDDDERIRHMRVEFFSGEDDVFERFKVLAIPRLPACLPACVVG